MANNISGASLDPIYQRLNSAPQYHPLEADTFADWAMEAGDIVTVSRDGKSYESPVHSSTVTWKKGQQVTVSSTGQEKRDSVTKMSQKKYNRGSSGLRNSENRYQQIITSYNGMTAGLVLASSSAALYVNNKYTQMQSGLYLTESSAHLYTENKYSQMSSGLKLTESSAHLYTNNKYTQMSSGLKLSESSAHLYVDNKYSQMTAGLKLSESSAHLYVNNKYTQMTSGLKLSESSAHLYTNNKYTQMSSGLKLTESSAHLYTNNKYTQMQSGLFLTESSAHLYTNNKYTQMSSGLKLTESSAHLYTNNKYTQMSSGLKLTESSAHLYTNNKYTQMSSGLKLTESSAHLYTNNKYTQMQSGLFLTESSAHLYTNSKYTQMSSGLKLTESSAHLYTNSKYTQMQSGLAVTMSSATLYAQNRTTRAYIMTRINADGEGEALIEANKVKISGTTTLNDIMTINSGSVSIRKDTRITGDIMAESLTLRDSNANSETIDTDDLKGVIKKAEVDGNTLKLTPVRGSVITFSKATSLSGEWSGEGKLTVTASPQGETFERLLIAKAATNNKIPIYAQYGPSGQYEEDTGFRVDIPAYSSRTLRCTSVEQTYPGSSSYYYYFRLEGNYSFQQNTNYSFYRQSWS